MRLSEIHIDGFGLFHDFHVTGIPPGLSILLGNNESGKSTLLAFLRSVLFGFLDRRSSQPIYPPLRGGRKGGRLIFLRGDPGERLIVERYEGKGGGALRVVFPDGTEGGEESLRHAIGSASRGLFENVFAFSLSELQEFKSLDADAVRDAITSAGLGAGHQTIPQAVLRIEKDRSELFVPRGQKRINKLVAQIEEFRQQIRDRKADPTIYEDRRAELDRCNEQLARTANDLEAARQRLDRTRLLAQAWSDWTTLQAAQQELADLPPLDSFPTDGLNRIEKLIDTRHAIEDQLGTLTTEERTLHEQISAIPIHPPVLPAADPIRKLERGRDTFEKESRDIPRQEELAAQAEDTFRNSLKDLGPEWDEAKLTHFDLSVPVQEQVRQHRERLQAADDDAARARARLEGAERSLAEARETELQAQETLARVQRPPDTLDEEGAERIRLQHEHYRKAEDDLPRVKTEEASAQATLTDTLREIGSDWDEAKLRGFDTSVAIRDEVRTHQDALARSRRRVEDAERDRARAEKLVQDAQANRARTEAAFAQIPEPAVQDPGELAERRRALHALRSLLYERSEAQARRDHLEERCRDLDDQVRRLRERVERAGEVLPAWPGWLLLALGVVGLAGVALAGSGWAALAILLVSLVSVLLAWGYHQFRSSRNRQQREERESLDAEARAVGARLSEARKQAEERQQAVRDLEERIRKQAQAASISGVPTVASVEDAEGVVERGQEALREWRSWRDRCVEAENAVRSAAEGFQVADAEMARARAHAQMTQEQWSAWLQGAGLKATLTPASAGEVVASLSAAREKLKTVEGLRLRIGQIESTVRQFQEELRVLLVRSGREPVPPDRVSETVLRLTEEIKRDQESRRQWESARLKRDDAVRLRERKAEDGREAAERLQVCDQDRERLRESWREWLRGAGLRESLSPEGAVQLLERVRTARTTHDVFQEKRREVVQTQGMVDAYVGQVAAVCRAMGRREPSAGDAGAVADALVTELTQAEEARRKSENLRARLDELEPKRRSLDGQRDRRDREWRDLLASAGASNEEEFRARAALYARRQQLQEAIRSNEHHIRQMVGLGDALCQFKSELASTTPERLAEERRILEQRVRELEQARDEEIRRQEKLREQLGQLEASEELSRLRLEEQAKLAELQAAAREWSVLSLSAWMIERARQRYERERRPAVLKDAERHFSRLTRGRYTEVVAPPGEGRIRVRTSAGQTLEVEELSRGTAEQLYLALRFGFVQEFVKRSESLPLIFDDILVNFDPDRARAALEAILDLAQSHQILFFTCHPESVALAHSIDPAVPVRRITDGAIEEL